MGELDAMEEFGAFYSDSTPAKQEDFKYFIKVYCEIVKRILQKPKQRSYALPIAVYLDLNAGPGWYTKIGIEGSPVIFYKTAQEANLPVHCFFIEKNAEACQHLSEYLNRLEKTTPYKVMHGENQEEVPKILRLLDAFILREGKQLAFGLLYSDPNGDIPPFEDIARLLSVRSRTRIDVLIYLSATTIKRVRRSSLCSMRDNLIEALSCIPKKFWLVREPVGRHQWTFLFGANWNGFPEFKNRGFHDLKSNEGREIMERLTYTSTELTRKYDHAQKD
jgi:three-Cys-motif partner protein